MILLVRQDHVAAVGARARTCDREPQPNASGFTVARYLEPYERLEHFFQLLRWNPGAVVVNEYANAAGVFAQAHTRAFAVADGIFRQIQDRALQADRTAAIRQVVR